MNDVILERTITLAGLMERWAGKRVGDYDLDFDGIKELIRQINPIPVYLLIGQLGFTGGHRKCRASKLSYPQMMDQLREMRGFYEVLFNLDDIEKFELDNFHREGKKSCKLKDRIAMWRKAMNNFTESETKIALVVIGKFQGKSHTDIGREVFSGIAISDMNNKIRRLKRQAQDLAEKHDLPMPEWSSRKK